MALLVGEPDGQGGLSDLLDEARAGSDDAWARIYRGLAPGVLGYLRARGAPDPEDLLGEVFLQVVRDVSRFDGSGPAFKAWVFKIARNRLVDDGRARSRRPEPSPQAEAEAIPGGHVEDEAVRNVTDGAVRAVIERLSPDQRDVLLLRILGGLTVSEVALALSRREGAVKALQHRGLASLRREISSGRIPFPLTDA